MSALDFPSSPVLGQLYFAAGRTWRWDGLTWLTRLPIFSDEDDNMPPGRLSLTSGLPITTADVSAATTIYYIPYLGDLIKLWNGTAWILYSFASEISLALGTLVSGKNYDVFVYQSSGIPTLEFLVWTSDLVRATAVTLQDGRYCKSGDKSRLYLGTFRTTSTTTTEDSGGGITTQVGGKRFLWNYYNRVNRSLLVFDSTDTWTYSNTTTWRQANGAAGNKVEFVQGFVEDVFDATVVASHATTSGAGQAQNSIGLDSITVPGGLIAGGYQTFLGTQTTRRNECPSAPGYHYLAWLERATNSGTTTWQGDGGANGWQCGLTVIIQG